MSTAINTDYTIGIKREIVTALQPLFGQDFPFDTLANKVYVGLEYPFTSVKFPAIYITYQEDTLQNAGVGHIETTIGEDGTPTQVKHWYFTGTINFNILALSPKVRDELGAALVNIIAFDGSNTILDGFKEELFNSTYVDLQILQDIIRPGGEVVGDVPWASETELTFATSYSLDVLGEFYSDPHTGNIIQIEHVQVYPHRPDQPPHWT